jgi:hypothetical protein
MPGVSVLLSTLPAAESSITQLFGRNGVFQEELLIKNKHAFLDPPGWSIFPCPFLREEKQKVLLKSGSFTRVRMRFPFATLFALG